MSGKPMTLGYWDFRGYGEVCRYILEYCNCEYEDKQYVRLSRNDHSPWRNIRDKFGLDFPNLPYLIDGDRKLTESFAIVKYVARKHDLVPKTEDDKIRADILEGVIVEFRTKFYNIFFCPEGKFEQFAKDFLESNLKPLLQKVTNFVGDRKWLISDELTYIDFLFYVRLVQAICIFPSCMDGFERLQSFIRDFQQLPGIKRYLNSGRFVEYGDHDQYLRKEYRQMV